MKYFIIIFFVILIVLGLVFFLSPNYFSQKFFQSSVKNEIISPLFNNSPILKSANPPIQENKDIQAPLDRAKERVMKKYFGIFINPQTSPIQPERFSGYHTGTDFEIFSEEIDLEVSVRAICQGKLEVKKFASGYGGVTVESCNLNSEPATIIYGHLKLTSIAKNVGENFNTGEIIGVLGKNKNAETDGERKHLHLGIHKGSTINLLGYVKTKNELANWIDPCLYVCN